MHMSIYVYIVFKITKRLDGLINSTTGILVRQLEEWSLARRSWQGTCFFSSSSLIVMLKAATYFILL
jgi:hypothetical protein